MMILYIYLEMIVFKKIKAQDGLSDLTNYKSLGETMTITKV